MSIIKNLKHRVRRIAQRIIGPPRAQNDRWRVLEDALEYVATMSRFEASDCQDSLRGDYFEFGVWNGATFRYAYQTAKHNPWMRFVACDSFEGLPAPEGIDSGAEFAKGQFACSRTDFENSLQNSDVDMEQVLILEGWFNESLTNAVRKKHNMNVVSVAYIDCDLYESCVPVMEFLTPAVRQGSILMFDDWFCFRADPTRGVQLATSEWLQKNPGMNLIPWKTFGPYGMAFFVNFKNNYRNDSN